MKKPKKMPSRARTKPKAKSEPVMVEVRTTKWGRPGETTVQRVRAPFVDKDTITIGINLNVREAETVVVRPVRREFDDLAGHLEDAERLANELR